MSTNNLRINHLGEIRRTDEQMNISTGSKFGINETPVSQKNFNSLLKSRVKTSSLL